MPNNSAQIGPPGAKLLAEPAVAQLAEQLLHQEVSMVTPAKRLLRCASSRWNLAQGELARRNPLLQQSALLAGKLWGAPHWRSARWAMLAIALTHIIGINTWAWHANTQLAQKRAAIVDTLRTTFPQTTAVVDAPLQMQRAVSSLSQASGAASAQDLETMLSALGAAPSMGRTSSAPSGIEFVPGELRIKGLNLPPDLAGDLERELQATGLNSRVDSDTLVVQIKGAP
jgi:general secretion pathway protein L